MNKMLLSNLWKYLRTGYSIYLSTPISMFNFLTLTYYLILSKLNISLIVLSSFRYFLVIGILFLIPIAIYLGWLHFRKMGIHGFESILLATSNPLHCYTSFVTMENNLKIMKELNIEPSNDWWLLFNYWKKHNNKWGWNP